MARLENYGFGHITVDGEEQTRDLIVLPDHLLTGWRRAKGHSLAMEDLDDVIDDLPERLILGCGHDGRLKPDPAVIEALRERGVEVEPMRTADAVRRYGELDPERTAAALHLTC